jgi:hypothetical protein
VNFGAVEQAMDAAVARGVFPGVVVLVNVGGRIVFLRAAGRRTLEDTDSSPMREDTIFDVASLTKPLATATAMMLSVRDRRIGLDDRVTRFFHNFGVHGKTHVTFRHLLAQTSGLPGWRPYYRDIVKIEREGRINFTASRPEVGFHTKLPVALGVGQSQRYVLRVIDGFAQADEDTVIAAVVDTTPPEVFCNAPTTMPPPNKPISFIATANDVCTTAVVPQLVSFECFKFDSKGKKLDKTKACKVALAGSKITISPPQGVGNHIAWTARAVDGSGNVGIEECEIEVVQQH